MMVSSFGNSRSLIARGFRAAAIGQTIAVFAQALLAGFALSGNSGSLNAHMANGAVALSFSILQALFGVLLRNTLPRWVLVASLGLFLGEMVQMVSGRFYFFAIHLPLGVALFATLVPVALWILGITPAAFDRARVADAAARTA